MSIPEYLESPDSELWRFDPGDNLFEWTCCPEGNQSKTIAFAPELASVLRSCLAQQVGLPELTIILFLYAAYRKGSDPRWLSRLLVDCANASSDAGLTARQQPKSVEVDSNRMEILKLFETFRKLGESGQRDFGHDVLSLYRGELSLYISIDRNAAEEAIEWLERNPNDRFAEQADDELSDPASAAFHHARIQRRRLYRTAACVEQIARAGFTVEQAEEIRDTGVEGIPEPSPLEPAEGPHRFAGLIDELLLDEELSSIAHSARQVSSVLALPLSPSDPSQLPIGGVSDISNRGDPERLLATELAADPMLLLARIATGQALYLRRESPPENGVRTRELLIENSVRTWGQVRLYALSVALGLAAGEQQRGESAVSIKTLAGDELVGEEFRFRSGIVDHLARLSCQAHPGLALLRWAEQREADPQRDELPVLILSDRTWNDQDFQSSVRETDCELLIVTVDQRGNLHLFRHDSIGDHSLKRLRLGDVDLKVRSGRSSVLRPTQTHSFALTLDHVLRFGTNSSPTWCAESTRGLWVRTPDERLLWYDDNAKGGRCVLQRFSYSNLLAWEAKQKRLELVYESSDEVRYASIDADTGVCSTCSIESLPNGEYFFDLSSLFHRSGAKLHLIDKMNGRVLDGDETRAVQLLGRPFRYDPVHGLRVYYQAGHRLESHSYSNTKLVPFCLALRDSKNVPTFLSPDLRKLIRADGSQDLSLVHSFGTGFRATRLVAVSSDSQRLIVDGKLEPNPGSTHSESVQAMVDCKTQKATRVYLNEQPIRPLVDLREPCAAQFRQVNTLNRLLGVGVDSRGLFLIPNGGRCPLRVRALRGEGFSIQRDEMAPASSTKHFGDGVYIEADAKRVVARAGTVQVHWKLRRAELGEIECWLDSRGLLHLVRLDDQSRLTLVLDMECMAGHFSEGESFGNPYYVEAMLSDESMEPSAKVYAWYEDWLRASKWWHK